MMPRRLNYWALKIASGFLFIIRDGAFEAQRRDRAAVNEAVRLADPDAIMAATSSHEACKLHAGVLGRCSQIEIDRCPLCPDSDQFLQRSEVARCAKE
jgi:hypothetical protein